jgi:hypothetical protein
MKLTFYELHLLQLSFDYGGVLYFCEALSIQTALMIQKHVNSNLTHK